MALARNGTETLLPTVLVTEKQDAGLRKQIPMNDTCTTIRHCACTGGRKYTEEDEGADVRVRKRQTIEDKSLRTHHIAR